jgi:hypothetical protein
MKTKKTRLKILANKKRSLNMKLRLEKLKLFVETNDSNRGHLCGHCDH